jgi:hypothetical protein
MNIILQKYVKVAQDLSPHKGTAFGPITIDGRLELFLFNLIYIWLYLQKKGIIELNGNNANDFVATGFVFFNEIKQSKNQTNIEISDFFKLFKDRFVKHKEELGLVRNSNYVPLFIFQCLFSKEQQQHEYYLMFWTPLLQIDSYKQHINNLEDILNRK